MILTSKSVIYSQAVDISSADVTLDQIYTVVYVGVSGALHFAYEDGTEETLENLAAGVWHRINVAKIFTDSTAESVHVGVLIRNNV